MQRLNLGEYMIGDVNNAQTCRTCDSEFAVDGYNIDEEITFCPYCGSLMHEDLDEDFYDDDNI